MRDPCRIPEDALAMSLPDAQGPHGPIALDCDRLKRTSGAPRDTGPGVVEPHFRSQANGPCFSCWPRRDHSFIGFNNGPNSRRWTVRLAQGRTTPRGLLSVGAGFLFPAWQLAIIRRQLCHLAGESLPRSAGAGGDSGSAPIAPGRRDRNRRRNASRPEHSAAQRVLINGHRVFNQNGMDDG
jgi:hypothetical protein